MSVYQRGDAWEVKVWSDGKQIVRRVDPRTGKRIRNKTHAKDVEAFLRLEREAATGHVDLTVTQLAATYWNKHIMGRQRSPKTRERVKTNLALRITHHIGREIASEVRRATLDDWVSDLIAEEDDDGERVHSDGSINEALATLTAIYNWGIRQELVEANPAARVERIKTVQRKRPLLTPEQVWSIIGACKYDRDRALIALLAFAGLRIGEAAGLKWTDIDESFSVAGIVRQHGPDGERPSPKMMKEGAVVLIGPLSRALRWWRAQCSSEWCFPLRTRRDRPIHHNQWRERVWRPACKAAGVEGAKPHDLRVFAGSYIASAADGDTTIAAGVLRHTNPALTAEKYVLPVNKLEVAAMAEFERRLLEVV